MVFIFSPQNWSHQFVSKHHYAIAFSKEQETIFFEPTLTHFGKFSINQRKPLLDNKNLSVVSITLPFPNWFRFKFNRIYKKINTKIIRYWIKKHKISPQLIIDFGCGKFITGFEKIKCPKKIYFPVDDSLNLSVSKRGCTDFFSVSKNIKEKFILKNIQMKWIDHGLSSVFAEKAKIRLSEIDTSVISTKDKPTKVGYSGNLSIPFLDRPILLELIKQFPEVEFHFFGNFRNDSDKAFTIWLQALRSLTNVSLTGQLSSEELAVELFKMDIQLLCYKPDYVNFHAENSHKINEYLSTGAPLVSTYIEVLKDNKDVFVCEKNKNEQLIDQFSQALTEIRNSDLAANKKRILFALEKEYYKLLKILN